LFPVHHGWQYETLSVSRAVCISQKVISAFGRLAAARQTFISARAGVLLSAAHDGRFYFRQDIPHLISGNKLFYELILLSLFLLTLKLTHDSLSCESDNSGLHGEECQDRSIGDAD